MWFDKQLSLAVIFNSVIHLYNIMFNLGLDIDVSVCSGRNV